MAVIEKLGRELRAVWTLRMLRQALGPVRSFSRLSMGHFSTQDGPGAEASEDQSNGFYAHMEIVVKFLDFFFEISSLKFWFSLGLILNFWVWKGPGGL